MDPKALKRMMDSMGMKTVEISADRVVIEGRDKDIIIQNPSITRVEVQGTTTFQIMGEVSEKDKAKVEISSEDIDMVRQQSGVDDEQKIRDALEGSGGDIAGAILKLKEN